MLPPCPPSPPEGPPLGTNFSRRNAAIPEPPSPATTSITTSSMNTASVVLEGVAQLAPQLAGHGEPRFGERLGRGERHHRLDAVGARAGVEGALEVREQLAGGVLGDEHRHRAQLAAPQVE